MPPERATPAPEFLTGLYGNSNDQLKVVATAPVLVSDNVLKGRAEPEPRP
jgi:hypothetical protein